MGRTADEIRYAMTDVGTRVEMLGGSRVILEGSDGIVGYGPEAIGFRCGRRQIWIRGEGLRLVCVDEDSAVVAGRIGEVVFV